MSYKNRQQREDIRSGREFEGEDRWFDEGGRGDNRNNDHGSSENGNSSGHGYNKQKSTKNKKAFSSKPGAK